MFWCYWQCLGYPFFSEGRGWFKPFVLTIFKWRASFYWSSPPFVCVCICHKCACLYPQPTVSSDMTRCQIRVCLYLHYGLGCHISPLIMVTMNFWPISDHPLMENSTRGKLFYWASGKAEFEAEAGYGNITLIGQVFKLDCRGGWVSLLDQLKINPSSLNLDIVGVGTALPLRVWFNHYLGSVPASIYMTLYVFLSVCPFVTDQFLVQEITTII